MPTDTNGNELMEIEEVAVSDGGVARFAPVNVSSGEEKYDVVWEATGKLMRFDEGENQWKERGEGVAKVLQRKDNKGRFMFIFRRDGVGKLAAQHYLVKSLTIKKHPQNEKAVLWSVLKDYTDDEEGFPESFLLRFPAKETTEKALMEMQAAVKNSNV